MEDFLKCGASKGVRMEPEEPGGDPAPGPQADLAAVVVQERLGPFVSSKLLQSPAADDDDEEKLTTPRGIASGDADEVEVSPNDVTDDVLETAQKSDPKPTPDTVHDDVEGLMFLKHDDGWVWEKPGVGVKRPLPSVSSPQGCIRPILPYPTTVVFGGAGASPADIEDFHANRSALPHPLPPSMPGSPAAHPEALGRVEEFKVMALRLHDEVINKACDRRGESVRALTLYLTLFRDEPNVCVRAHAEHDLRTVPLVFFVRRSAGAGTER